MEYSSIAENRFYLAEIFTKHQISIRSSTCIYVLFILNSEKLSVVKALIVSKRLELSSEEILTSRQQELSQVIAASHHVYPSERPAAGDITSQEGSKNKMHSYRRYHL